VDRLLARPDSATAAGRDKAMLELLYASGLRVSELVACRSAPSTRRPAVVRVRGKGGKERIVPVGERAREALASYGLRCAAEAARHAALDGSVRHTARRADDAPGFLEAARRHARAAGIEQRVYPHTLRHSFAPTCSSVAPTCRAVQAMLGHADIAPRRSIRTSIASASRP